MRALMPIANGGVSLEAIIWLIILIFWGIAQFIQKAREAGRSARPSRPPRPQPESPLDDELKRMLEELTGVPSRESGTTVLEEQTVEPSAETPPPRPPPPVQRPSRPVAPSRPKPVHARVRFPPPETERPPPAPVVAPPPAAVPVEPAAATTSAHLAYAAVGEHAADVGGVQAVGRFAMAGIGSAAMQSRIVRSPRMPLMTTRMTGHLGAPLISARELRDKQELKRAVLAKMILDPPIALAPPRPRWP